MKIFTDSIDWADEGDVFFYSLIGDGELQALKELLQICIDLNIFSKEEYEMYWGTNECFRYTPKDFMDFVNEAVDITKEELAVFKKFTVSGFDIYDQIKDIIADEIYNNWRDNIVNNSIDEEGLKKLKPAYIKLFGESNRRRCTI